MTTGLNSICSLRQLDRRRVAHVRQSVQKIRARARVMFSEAQDVAAMHASSGEQKVITLASGETKQLKLALIRLSLHLRLRGCMSQPDVSFDTVTKHARRAFQLFARHDGRTRGQLADRMQRCEQPSLGLFKLLLAPVRTALHCRRFRR